MPAAATKNDYLPPYLLDPEVSNYQTAAGSYSHAPGESTAFFNSNLYRSLKDQQRIADAIVDYNARNVTKHTTHIIHTFERKLVRQHLTFDQIDLTTVRKSVLFVAMWAALTNPVKMGVDVTEESSVIFTLSYGGKKDAYLELFFEPGASEPVQHNFTVYENANPLFSYGGTFFQTLQQFLSWFKPVILLPL